MASHTWIPLYCVLLAALHACQGINLSMTRTLGADYCGFVECTHDASQPHIGKYNVKRISILDITKSGNKFPLAILKQGDASLFIDPTKVNTINGTSKVTQFHADLALNLRDPTDCLYASFQCEVEYVDISGKKQVVRKTVAPDEPQVDDDCSCSSIRYQLGRLTNRANGASRQVYGLALNLENLDVDLSQVMNDSSELSKDIARIQGSHDEITKSVEDLRQEGRDIDGLMTELRHNDSVLQASITDLKRVEQDILESSSALKQSDKSIDKQLNELDNNNKNQLNVIDKLQEADGVASERFSHLSQNDRELKKSVNNLKNESSSVRSQILQLGVNDNKQRNDINALEQSDNSVQAAINVAKQTDDAIDRNLQDLTRTNMDIQEDLAEAQHAAAAKDKDISELRKAYNDIQSEVSRQRQNDKVIDDRTAALKNKDSDIQKTLNTLLRTDVLLDQAINALQTANDVQQSTIDDLRRNDTVNGLLIADLRVNSRVTDDSINGLASSNSAMRAGFSAVTQQQSDIRDTLDSLYNQLVAVQGYVSTKKITTVTKTTSSLVLTSCSRGMAHTQARAPIMLYGSFPALCDMETDGGGWLVFQRRTSGDVDFYKPWSDYKIGFGIPGTSFYLGNDLLHNLTSSGSAELRIDFVFNGKPYYAQYSSFSVGDEASKYRLSVGSYKGTAGDSLTYHDGQPFSTYDQDNDDSTDHCAVSKHGAWWHKDCYQSNLNGAWGKDDETGVIWKALSPTQSVSLTEMKLRYLP